MNIVFSPHVDDAIFSIGAHLTGLRHVVIATPMAGIPDDDAGRAKHTRLREEHANACSALGATWRNGNFLDDVYPAPRRLHVKAWLHTVLAEYHPDAAFIPFGIHHPDHLLVSNLLIGMIDTPPEFSIDIAHMPDRIYFYEELPYRVDYPHLVDVRFSHIENSVGRLRRAKNFDGAKQEAVECYASQIDWNLLSRVMVPERERIWELIR